MNRRFPYEIPESGKYETGNNVSSYVIQQTFTCFKSTIETPEKGVIYIHD